MLHTCKYLYAKYKFISRKCNSLALLRPGDSVVVTDPGVDVGHGDAPECELAGLLLVPGPVSAASSRPAEVTTR